MLQVNTGGWTTHTMLKVLLSLVDIVIGVGLVWGGLLLSAGVHSGYSALNRLAGVLAVLAGAALLTSIYTSALKHPWKLRVRTIVYLVLFLFVSVAYGAFLFDSEQERTVGDHAFFLVFCVLTGANTVHSLFLSGFGRPATPVK